MIIFSSWCACSVSEVSSFLSVPLLSCLLDVNSASETPRTCQVQSFHLIKPGLCPLCLHLSVTMIHTVWSSLSSDMRSHETCKDATCTYHILLHLRKWAEGDKVGSVSPVKVVFSQILSCSRLIHIWFLIRKRGGGVVCEDSDFFFFYFTFLCNMDSTKIDLFFSSSVSF